MKTIYSKSIGYSPVENVDVVKLARVISIFQNIALDHFIRSEDDKILVAGTGDGSEAALIAKEFGIFTTGVDINIPRYGKMWEEKLALSRQDLGCLGFLDSIFTLIYSYHVLEHVNDPLLVLGELRRVLKPKGILFIGFPNKHRMVSYLGTSQKASIWQKIKWNIHDYRCRLAGEFRNEYGAHAGFTQKEFMNSASKLFSSVVPVRNDYMVMKYQKMRFLIKLFIHYGFSEFVFPSNYFICIK